MLNKPTEKQKIGRIGEDIAVKYLENKGFVVIERNYLKKCGEIDIIAKKGKIVHFIEVKSVSELANSRPGYCGEAVKPAGSEVANSETDKYRPEDNIHPAKLKRLARTIQLYLFEKYGEGEIEWVFDAVVVFLDVDNHRARIRFLENIVL